MSERPPAIPRAIATEKTTVEVMVRLYCAEHHGRAVGICTHCAALLGYAHARLDACPYGADKPACRACPIHCYRPAEREAMRNIMRLAGPRMLLCHPWLTVVHLWKERFHKTPRRRSRTAGSATAP
jgi:hypothetical protein